MKHPNPATPASPGAQANQLMLEIRQTIYIQAQSILELRQEVNNLKRQVAEQATILAEHNLHLHEPSTGPKTAVKFEVASSLDGFSDPVMQHDVLQRVIYGIESECPATVDGILSDGKLDLQDVKLTDSEQMDNLLIRFSEAFAEHTQELDVALGTEFFVRARAYTITSEPINEHSVRVETSADVK